MGSWARFEILTNGPKEDFQELQVAVREQDKKIEDNLDITLSTMDKKFKEFKEQLDKEKEELKISLKNEMRD